jgi:thioredoxin-related protein
MNRLKILLPFNFILFFSMQSIIFSQNNPIEDFAIYSVSGERIIFSEMLASLPDNGFLIINFTSVNCIPCKKEIPELKELIIKYKNKAKLICVYSEAGKPVQDLAESLGVIDIAFVDPFGKVQSIFAIKSVPVTILFSKKSLIIQRLEGYTQKNMKALEEVLKKNR